MTQAPPSPHNSSQTPFEISPYRRHWSLLCEGPMGSGGFLNHGSFGACPDAVVEAQRVIRDEFEHEPVAFINEKYEPATDRAREALAQFLNADASGLAFVRNATEGVNAVLRSLELEPGDELLTSNHEYNACNNAMRYVAERAGARVVSCDIPFPIESEDQVIETYMSHVTERTKLAMVSHVTSPTAIVLPVKKLNDALRERGVDLLVDGAHAPGMVELDVDDIDAPWYTANCHKWMCAPKGAAFLWTRADKRETTRPAIISHGANAALGSKSRYLTEFDWTGTHDPSAHLSVPAAIEALGSMHADGWAGVRAHNRELALKGRDILMRALDQDVPPAPDSMIGSIASLVLPDRPGATGDGPGGMSVGSYAEEIQVRLVKDHNIQVPVMPWPEAPRRLIRISAQLYNHESEYHALARALSAELDRERGE